MIIQKFKSYCEATAKIYFEEYNWFPMPPSCRMILIHGPDIINSFSLPIGQLSEEAQEAKNKDFKRVREYNTRKSSVINTNEDLMCYLQVSSDPYIGYYRSTLSKKQKSVILEAADLMSVDENEDDN